MKYLFALHMCLYVLDWLEFVCSWIISELDTKTQNETLLAVPVLCGGQWRSAFPGADDDSKEGDGEGFPMWYVNR